MKSMTGYGTAKGAKADVEVEVSLKAVNGRFLDVRMHVPREYAEIESEIKKLIGTTFQRGTVDVYISRRVGPSGLQAQVKVQADLAKKWVKAYRQLGKELRLEEDLKLELVVRQPGVLEVEHRQRVSTQEKGLLLSALKKAVDSCQEERTREGRSLQSDLNQKLEQLTKLVKLFAEMKEQANAELAQRYEQRLRKFQVAGEVEPQRLAQEVVIQLDKADISEEITRLTEHIRAMKTLIAGKVSQGKKLDFYTQELLREVNTIGSKSQIARLTKSVVDAKAIIERVREQVQNVE